LKVKVKIGFKFEITFNPTFELVHILLKRKKVIHFWKDMKANYDEYYFLFLKGELKTPNIR